MPKCVASDCKHCGGVLGALDPEHVEVRKDDWWSEKPLVQMASA